MRVGFRLSNGMLDPVAPAELGLKGRRPVGEGEVRRFGDWAATYRSHVGRDDRRAELLRLGRDLYGRVDGGERWLATLLRRHGGEVHDLDSEDTTDGRETCQDGGEAPRRPRRAPVIAVPYALPTLIMYTICAQKGYAP